MFYPLLIISQALFYGLIFLSARARGRTYLIKSSIHAKRRIVAVECKYDSDPAQVVHTALHMGKDIATWSCNMSATLGGDDSDEATASAQENSVDLCPAKCTTYCKRPAYGVSSP